jgi:hypothetical protein
VSPSSQPPRVPAMPRASRPSFLEMALVAGEAALYSAVDVLAHAFAVSAGAEAPVPDRLVGPDSVWPAPREAA